MLKLSQNKEITRKTHIKSHNETIEVMIKRFIVCHQPIIGQCFLICLSLFDKKIVYHSLFQK